ncbi:unnamed protein product [Amoebophrya sp. A25]|nr:unnamed protein product [Amoebophrya sp. A25]|eukprot:GSA25T00006888001.1
MTCTYKTPATNKMPLKKNGKKCYGFFHVLAMTLSAFIWAEVAFSAGPVIHVANAARVVVREVEGPPLEERDEQMHEAVALSEGKRLQKVFRKFVQALRDQLDNSDVEVGDQNALQEVDQEVFLKQDASWQCPVCLTGATRTRDGDDEVCRLFPCGHFMHKECAQHWKSACLEKKRVQQAQGTNERLRGNEGNEDADVQGDGRQSRRNAADLLRRNSLPSCPVCRIGCCEQVQEGVDHLDSDVLLRATTALTAKLMACGIVEVNLNNSSFLSTRTEHVVLEEQLPEQQDENLAEEMEYCILSLLVHRFLPRNRLRTSCIDKQIGDSTSTLWNALLDKDIETAQTEKMAERRNPNDLLKRKLREFRSTLAREDLGIDLEAFQDFECLRDGGQGFWELVEVARTRILLGEKGKTKEFMPSFSADGQGSSQNVEEDEQGSSQNIEEDEQGSSQNVDEEDLPDPTSRSSDASILIKMKNMIIYWNMIISRCSSSRTAKVVLKMLRRMARNFLGANHLQHNNPNFPKRTAQLIRFVTVARNIVIVTNLPCLVWVMRYMLARQLEHKRRHAEGQTCDVEMDGTGDVEMDGTCPHVETLSPFLSTRREIIGSTILDSGPGPSSPGRVLFSPEVRQILEITTIVLCALGTLFVILPTILNDSGLLSLNAIWREVSTMGDEDTMGREDADMNVPQQVGEGSTRRPRGTRFRGNDQQEHGSMIRDQQHQAFSTHQATCPPGFRPERAKDLLRFFGQFSAEMIADLHFGEKIHDDAFAGRFWTFSEKADWLLPLEVRKITDHLDAQCRDELVWRGIGKLLPKAGAGMLAPTTSTGGRTSFGSGCSSSTTAEARSSGPRARSSFSSPSSTTLPNYDGHEDHPSLEGSLSVGETRSFLEHVEKHFKKVFDRDAVRPRPSPSPHRPGGGLLRRRRGSSDARNAEEEPLPEHCATLWKQSGVELLCELAANLIFATLDLESGQDEARSCGFELIDLADLEELLGSSEESISKKWDDFYEYLSNALDTPLNLDAMELFVDRWNYNTH